MRKFILALTALTTLGLGAVAVASPGGPGLMPEFDIARALHALDLTPDQRVALRALRASHQAEFEARRAEREQVMATFRAQLLADQPDAALLHALIDERSDDALQAAHDRLDAMLDVHAVLTPAQRQQVADLLDQARQRHGERFERLRAHRPE